jgi:hypothetical protein
MNTTTTIYWPRSGQSIFHSDVLHRLGYASSIIDRAQILHAPCDQFRARLGPGVHMSKRLPVSGSIWSPGPVAWSAGADGRFRSHGGACPPFCVRLRRCGCGVVQGRGPNRNRGQAVICRTLHATDILKEAIRHIKASPPLDNPSRCGLPVMNG